MEKRAISNRTLKRLPLYLGYLKGMPEGEINVSATSIAERLGLNEVQVRKDLALASSGGRPKVGYVRRALIEDLERFLRYDALDRAVLVGTGYLGHALLCYEGFARRGLEIVAGFDADPTRHGQEICGKPVLSMDQLASTCERLQVRIGIITVPEYAAQQVCDQLVEAGVLAIWNFAPIRLNAPERVLVQNEGIESSLAVLSTRLAERLEAEAVAKTDQAAEEGNA